jgi:UPF0755 protein
LLQEVFSLHPGEEERRVVNKLRWLLILVLVLLVFVGVELYRVFYNPNHFSGADEKMFYVSKGQTFASVVDSLEAAGIIRNRTAFVFVARLHGGTTRVQIGKYKFGTGISNYDLLLALTQGKNVTLISVTIPEGLMARQQAHILARMVGIDSVRFMSLVRDESFAHSLGINSHSLEGYLFPETYSFYWQADEEEIITRLVKQYQAFYDDSLQARASDLGWTTNQVMALASIVEGEAVLAEERPIISGVYQNRLRKGMKLEADPTIRFMIAEGPRRILYSDLQVSNPYNTYRNRGLPPGPINNPGKASILAALFPARHNYLFFVANGKGGHWFSSTYAEHLRYVRKYRRERRLRDADSITETAGKTSGR